MDVSTTLPYFRSKTFLERSSNHRFAYTVKTMDELSPELSQWLEESLLPGETVYQRIVIPHQKYYTDSQRLFFRILSLIDWKISPDHLLVLTDQRILLFCFPLNKTLPSLAAAPIDCVQGIELGRILLVAWLEWCWTSADGLQRSRIYFNPARDRFFTQMQNRLTSQLMGLEHKSGSTGLDFNYELAELPIKFRNHAESVLLPGDPLEGIYFRESLGPQKHLAIFGVSSPPALLLLTSTYLILAEEAQQPTSHYGTVTRWRLRSSLKGFTFQTQNNQTSLVLSFGPSNATEILRLAVEPESQAGLRELLGGWLG